MPRGMNVPAHGSGLGLLAGAALAILTGAARGADDLDVFLDSHPRIADAIRWRKLGEPEGVPYRLWPEDEKDELRAGFRARLEGTSPDLEDPPANIAGVDPESPIKTVIATGAARALYIAWVAHCLDLERSRALGWSLADAAPETLGSLLGSGSFFHPSDDPPGYRLWCGETGEVVPAPPRVALAFLVEHNLIRRTERETVLAVCEWSRRLTHFLGGYTLDNLDLHWHYRGMTPVSRMMQGTARTGETERRHYTAGCHGTAGWLKCLLRAVNIPVLEVPVEGHATVQFPTVDLALSHGDDLYAQTGVRAPVAELFITMTEWRRWFQAEPDWRQRERNVGRGLVRLAMSHSSPYLEALHRQDLADRRSRATSRVYEVFSRHYGVAEVEAAGVWKRLEQADSADPRLRPTGGTKPAAIVIEAETLTPEVTGGTAVPQDMRAFGAGRWSGDRQLWWSGGMPGDTLRLPFRVPREGRWRIGGVFTRAPDYGRFTVRLADQKQDPARVDGFGPEVSAGPETMVGEFHLPAGEQVLECRLTGRDEKASPGWMIGLDRLLLLPLE